MGLVGATLVVALIGHPQGVPLRRTPIILLNFIKRLVRLEKQVAAQETLEGSGQDQCG